MNFQGKQLFPIYVNLENHNIQSAIKTKLAQYGARKLIEDFGNVSWIEESIANTLRSEVRHDKRKTVLTFKIWNPDLLSVETFYAVSSSQYPKIALRVNDYDGQVQEFDVTKTCAKRIPKEILQKHYEDWLEEMKSKDNNRVDSMIEKIKGNRSLKYFIENFADCAIKVWNQDEMVAKVMRNFELADQYLLELKQRDPQLETSKNVDVDDIQVQVTGGRGGGGGKKRQRQRQRIFDNIDLTALNSKQLKQLASEAGIHRYGSMRVSELITSLEAIGKHSRTKTKSRFRKRRE